MMKLIGAYESGRDMSDQEIGQSLVQSLANLRSMEIDRPLDTKPKKRSLEIVTAEDYFVTMAAQLSMPNVVERPKKCKSFLIFLKFEIEFQKVQFLHLLVQGPT